MRPLSVHMYLTTVCNLACTHCYYDALRVGDNAGRLLTATEIVSIITFLGDNFEADLHLEGGEMFLRDDIEEILNLLPKSHFRLLTFTTSGTVPIRVSPHLLKDIGELRISVEGHTDAVQGKMRPANLAKVRKTIDQLRTNNVDFTLRVTLFSGNAHLITEMIDAFVSWGVKRLSLFEFQPVGRGEQHVDEFSLSDEQFENVLQTLAKMKLPDQIELLKFNLSPKRIVAANLWMNEFVQQGYKFLPLDAIPNLTVNANGDMGVSPWLATAAKLGDKFANIHELDFSSEILRREKEGHLNAFCPYTTAMQVRYVGLSKS